MRKIENSFTLSVSFDNGVSFETLEVTLQSANLFRALSSPTSTESVSYGDVFSATQDASGRWYFDELISVSGLKKFSWILSRKTVDSPEFAAFCDTVMREGGMWERIIGGVVIVHIPPTSRFDPRSEIEQLTEKIHPG